jgi:hypothetical protein
MGCSLLSIVELVHFTLCGLMKYYGIGENKALSDEKWVEKVEEKVPIRYLENEFKRLRKDVSELQKNQNESWIFRMNIQRRKRINST